MNRSVHLMFALALACVTVAVRAPVGAQAPAALTRIATNLLNPRGVAVLPDGRLLVAEAGTGSDGSGELSVFDDLNGDGDYDDPGERAALLDHLPSYNILTQFNPGRDEVLGIGDVLVIDDGRIYYTLDDHFDTLAILGLNADFSPAGTLITRDGSLNALAYDPNTQTIYVVESSLNTVSAVMLDGSSRTVTAFGLLAHNQQAVPAGIAVDPLTGDLLVALFSGQLWDYYGAILSFMPGDSKIVRVDPVTGEARDEITGLTTAIDVAVDEVGSRYVLEMTTRWATPPLTDQFDLFDPDAPPDPGGYERFSGRLTRYPADGGDPVILADDLDTPTNLTYHAGMIYISTGEGTPGRPIWGRRGATRINGAVYALSVMAHTTYSG